MKLKKVLLSSILATSLCVMPSFGVRAVEPSAPSATTSIGTEIGKFFMGIFERTIGDALARLIDMAGLLDFDSYFVLGRYGEDLNDLAKEGKIHDSIGRDKEIDEMINILSTKGKGNPIITGVAGVGKTALVEGLAYRIVHGQVPENFKNKRIIKINMVALIAGDTYTGTDRAMSRIRSLLKAAERDPDIILFIDEFHQIVNCNAAELFKTYLDRGSVKMIAATTTSEYAYIAKDEALQRRFTTVKVDEPTKHQTVNILKGLKCDFEKQYNVEITDEAIMTSVDYTDKYMKNKHFPDKAIDVIIHTANFISNSKKESDKTTSVVSKDDIIATVSRETNIPLGKIDESELKFLDGLEKRVKNIVVGQEKAVETLCDAIKNSRSGIKDFTRPQLSLFLTGTKGVGKEVLARSVGNEIGSFIEVDFANYTSADAIKKLFNSKIFGYNGGLSEQIGRKPRSIVYFNNIEEAHPEAIKDILSIIKKGYALDSSGNEIDFKNAFIILNSKIGEQDMLKCETDEPSKEAVKNINQKIEEKFGGDFFNSLDDVVVFNKLSQENYKKIGDIIFDNLENSLSSQKNIKVKISEEVRNYICKGPVNHKLGAESITKSVKNNIYKKLSKYIISGEVKEESEATFVMKDGKIEVIIKNEPEIKAENESEADAKKENEVKKEAKPKTASKTHVARVRNIKNVA